MTVCELVDRNGRDGDDGDTSSQALRCVTRRVPAEAEEQQRANEPGHTRSVNVAAKPLIGRRPTSDLRW